MSSKKGDNIGDKTNRNAVKPVISLEDCSRGGKMSSRKGIPNKSTKEIREAFQFIVSASLPKLFEKYDKMIDENPEKALDIMIKLSEFIVPKLQRVEMSGELSIENLLQLTPEQRKARIIELANKKINNK